MPTSILTVIKDQKRLPKEGKSPDILQQTQFSHSPKVESGQTNPTPYTQDDTIIYASNILLPLVENLDRT
jgi:hypothetical protein